MRWRSSVAEGTALHRVASYQIEGNVQGGGAVVVAGRPKKVARRAIISTLQLCYSVEDLQGMIVRQISAEISSLLRQFPAVVLLGPRQVGKTTLAVELGEKARPPATYLDLELASDRAKLSEPEIFLATQQRRLLILDEIQRVPEIFQTLRGTIDQRKRQGEHAGQFLLLGSASMDLLQQSSETLAGRIASVELTPFLVDEVADDAASRNRLWERGGFPDSYLASSGAASRRWRQQFITTYLERDIPSLGPRVPAETLRRFWTMLAHRQGELLNAAALATGLGVSGQTVARYVDLMVDLLLVRRLAPWAENVGKRLVRSPKIYLRDPGIVHALLGIDGYEALLGHPVVGGSWEGWVVENLIAVAPVGTQAWFYRTGAGAEIDLVLEISSRERWAIEVKRSVSPVVSKGFYLGCTDVKATRRLVIHAGDSAFGLGDGIEAMPLRMAVAALRKI